MHRRSFLKSSAALSVLATGCARVVPEVPPAASASYARVRPGDARWPSERGWNGLAQSLRGRLIQPGSPLATCGAAPDGPACAEVVERLANPYFLGDEPALTQSSGWVDAWRSAPSAYAVAAEDARDVAAAVAFAREHDLRLVVKGGGHSYQGTSCAPDSLLIWTRAMNDITVHDAFVPRGCGDAPRPAVTVGAGALWGHVYDAVTTRAGRYVQGGGCTTVGVAGLVQSGGFGSHSKRYGLAAGSLLEAEVVTADGGVRVVNRCAHPDLFWALKGGGGGSFGVVTRLTLATHDLPEHFGGAWGSVQASSDEAYRSLVAEVLRFYRDHLLGPHWGEQIRFEPDRRVRFNLVSQGLDAAQAEAAWRPLRAWVDAHPADVAWSEPLALPVLPAQRMWDYAFLSENAPGIAGADDRVGAPEGNWFWSGQRNEIGQFLHGYRSAWLPASLLAERQQEDLADALVTASRRWTTSLHLNKGLAGAPQDALASAAGTAMNPDVLGAFALAIIAGEGPPAFSDLPGPGPDLDAARRDAEAINASMAALRRVAPEAGSYVSESDYFERDWQRSFWGANYGRLRAVKDLYDPDGLFFVHHGVGSEDWSGDGFTRRPTR